MGGRHPPRFSKLSEEGVECRSGQVSKTLWMFLDRVTIAEPSIEVQGYCCMPRGDKVSVLYPGTKMQTQMQMQEREARSSYD